MSAPAVERSSCWDLVEAAQRGDADAYGQLWSQYRGVVLAFVQCRVGDPVLAEELTSETFLRGLRRLDSVSYQGRDVAAWFVTIARNLILDHVKSARYRLEVPCWEFTDADRGIATDVAGVVERRSVAEWLRRCVASLSADYARVIELRFYEGLSVDEAAAVMGRGPGALKALQHRAVRRLAELVDPALV